MKLALALTILFAASATFAGSCYEFTDRAPKYLGNKYVGPKAPLGICFKYPVAGTRFHPRTHARFYVFGQYTGVFIMGPLDFVKSPGCQENCVALAGIHFDATIKLNVRNSDSPEAILEDVMNKDRYIIRRMSDADTKRILNF